MTNARSRLQMLALALAVAPHPAIAQEHVAAETRAQQDARMSWWREARFGMFVHWGPVSLKGTEIGWSRDPGPNGARGGSIPAAEYDALYEQFNPTRFDARRWVAVAQSAGMKYVVFTTKHHDGFCEFDSALTDYKITSPKSPFHRDVVKELADACHAAGMRLGFYYSQPDEHHPDYRTQHHARYVEYLHGQVAELLTNYGRVDVLWFDGLGGSAEDWRADELFPRMRKLQPGLIVNDRCGLPADFDTPEQTIGRFQNTRAWETCMTICNQWAWKPGDEMKSLEQCIRTLVRCAGGDGNLLFNVGPMPSGEIEPRQVARLEEMGEWLAKFGASIYGTRGGPIRPGAWGCTTSKGNTLYVHVFEWSGEGLRLPALDRKVLSATLLTGGFAGLHQDESGIELRVAAPDRRPIDTIVALTLDGTAVDAKCVSSSLCSGRKATASNVFRAQESYAAGMAFDDDESTRWATDSGTHSAWLEVDLGVERELGRVRIVQEAPFAPRVARFELQREEGGQWKPFYAGTKTPELFEAAFAPVRARKVRLAILEASEGPTINEFQIFAPKAK
jgi:alpha-L-fucosidase